MTLERQSQLIERLVAYLTEHGGHSSVAEICSEVFDIANCSDPIARRLVAAAVAGESRISMLSEGGVRLSRARNNDPLISRLRYAVIDLETTGLPPPKHRVTEVAAVLVERGKITDDFSTLINPGVPIPRRIISMTGITNEMVVDAPEFEEVADALVDILGKRVLVAHNGSFDVNFLNSELERARGTRIANPTLCTVRLTRALLPGLESYKLGSVANYFGVDIEGRHRALGDAAATAAIFIRLCEIAEDNGLAKLSQLMNIAGVKLTDQNSRRNSGSKNRK
ncbi:MAG TPA: 3'-5' exonuclease [Acidobacteriota bacterium]|nr:3'-5' exonuclease [Acidobacteriota bacterium]